MRSRYGLENSADASVILYLGSHAPNKGLPLLLEAAIASQEKFTLFIGGEKRPHIDYEGALARLRHSQRIIFLGYVSDDTIHDFYQLADIFVFPSLADTFPLVVLEAMSHGLAIVASRVGGVPFQLSEDCGILIEPGNAKALTAAIDLLIKSPQLRAAFGARAAQKVKTKFSWSSAATEAYRLYQIVANGSIHS
jgi:glycosyltransferase involved in cell wall biosynthesis